MDIQQVQQGQQDQRGQQGQHCRVDFLHANIVSVRKRRVPKLPFKIWKSSYCATSYEILLPLAFLPQTICPDLPTPVPSLGDRYLAGSTRSS